MEVQRAPLAVCYVWTRDCLLRPEIQQLSVSLRLYTLLGSVSPAGIGVGCRVQNFDAVRAAVEYSRPKDFFEVEYLLDVVDVLLPRAVAGLAVLFRHFSRGARKEDEEAGDRRGRAGGEDTLPEDLCSQLGASTEDTKAKKVVRLCVSPTASWLFSRTLVPLLPVLADRRAR